MHIVDSEDPGLSDHCLIYGLLKCRVQGGKHKLMQVRRFCKCDTDKLVLDLDTAPWQVMGALKDVDSQWSYWKKLFNEVVDSHVPVKKVRVQMKSLPWITMEVWVLMRVRTYHLTKVKKSMGKEDWIRCKSVRNQLKQCMRRVLYTVE